MEEKRKPHLTKCACNLFFSGENWQELSSCSHLHHPQQSTHGRMIREHFFHWCLGTDDFHWCATYMSPMWFVSHQLMVGYSNERYGHCCLSYVIMLYLMYYIREKKMCLFFFFLFLSQTFLPIRLYSHFKEKNDLRLWHWWCPSPPSNLDFY